MLATGIKSPIGVKVSGSDLAAIDHIAREVERVAKGVPGASSALAERLTGGRYVDVQIYRIAAARYGLNISDVQAIVAGAIRSEEHTSELPSLMRRSYAVICLTKKNTKGTHHMSIQSTSLNDK